MNWNYEEIANKLAMGRIDLEEESIPFMLDEARKRHDSDVLANLASVWFEDIKGDKRRALELFVEAAGLGSPDANYRLGHEYRSGEILPRDYEKAYVSFRKGEECDWVPIDPEDNMSAMEDYDGEVTSEFLLLHGAIDWWRFLLANHPNRALKCGMADWYIQQGGDENREKALKLFEESANEGFEFAFFRLIEFYSKGEFEDIDTGKYWLEQAKKRGFDESRFAGMMRVAQDAQDNCSARYGFPQRRRVVER